MKKTKQELKYQASQQLTAKFACTNGFWWNDKADISQLLKKVVR